MGLNLNSDRRETATTPAPAEELYLYSSDRVAQLLGCGLLTLSFRVNALMELFEEGREMVFADTPEAMREAALRYRARGFRAAAHRRGGLAQGAAQLQRAAGSPRSSKNAVPRRLSHAYAWPTVLW